MQMPSPETWEKIIFILFGSFLGLVISQVTEFIKRHREQKNQKKVAKQLIAAVIGEVEEGILRCEGLVEKIAIENKVSFSRIYVSFWNSMIAEISKSVEQPSVLKLLHKIYYRFDLVNFNMNREAFGAGAGFAKEYLEEMKDNLSMFKKKVGYPKDF